MFLPAASNFEGKRTEVDVSCLHHNDKQGYAVVTNVAIGNPERHVRKASHRGSKQQ